MFSLFAQGNGDYVTVKDVEFLGVGTWLTKNGPTPVSPDYINTVAKNINSGEFASVGLSFGHNTDPKFVEEMSTALGMGKIALTGGTDGSGQVAFGTVANARVNGNKLIGDIVNVPKKLAERIGKEYINVSPTIVDYWPGPKGNIIKGPVMIALGLLGGEHPAFSAQKGLAHAKQLASQFGAEFDEDAITVFTGIQYTEENPAEKPKTEEPEMGDENKQVVEFTMPEEMKNYFSGITDLLKKQDERMTKLEEDGFRKTVESAAEGWNHIQDPAEKVRVIGAITQMNGASPEMAQMLIAEHTKLGASAGNGQRNRPADAPADWFARQSMFAGGGNHNPRYDFGGGEPPHKVVLAGVQRYMQERNVGYIEAREMYSQTAEGAAAIRAAEAQNEMLNGGNRNMMDRMPMPNPQNDRNQPIGAMRFGGGEPQSGNLDELASFFQMRLSQGEPGNSTPAPGNEPMTVGVPPTG